MKTRYIVKNIDKTVQRLQEEQGKYVLIEPGQSIITTCPPKPSYIFEITEIMAETEMLIKKKSKEDLLKLIEPFILNKKVMTNKEWKSLDADYDDEAKILYNLLESYVIGKKVLSKSEFEKLKSGTENQNQIQGGLK